MKLNMNVLELVQQPSIPVYGLSDNLFDLTLASIGMSSRRADDGRTQIPATITLGFARDYMDIVTSFNLYSCNSSDAKTRAQVLKIPESHPYPQLSMDNRTLRLFRIAEDAQRLLGQPAKVVEQITVMGRTFTLEARYWELPPRPAWFLLQNEDELFYGQALGFAREELFQLLQKCVVVNDDARIIQRYQQELDRYLAFLRDQL